MKQLTNRAGAPAMSHVSAQSADTVGSPARNLELAEARAGTVRDALVVRGIDANAADASGLSDPEEKPMYSSFVQAMEKWKN